MKVVKPKFEVLTTISEGGLAELIDIERAARTCYKSTPKEPAEEATKNFVRNLIKNGHEAMLEHSMISVRFIVDRGVSHEMVRHRMASFAQESTRWCNYSKQQFNNEITFIKPCYFKDDNGCGEYAWTKAMMQCEESYFEMLKLGYTPQEARAVLPNSLKTEILVTANYREWRHILKLRCAKDAHPQMKEVMIPLLIYLRWRIPVIFEDIEADWNWYLAHTGFDGIEVFANHVSLYSTNGDVKVLGEEVIT